MADVTFADLLKDAKKQAGVIPDGKYPFQCIAAEATVSSSGNPMIKGSYRCVSGQYAGRTIISRETVVLDNPSMVLWFVRKMAAFGITETFIAGLGAVDEVTLAQVAERMLNKTVTLALDSQEWNGQKRNNVKDILSYTGAAVGASVVPGNGAAPAPAPAPAPSAAAPAPAASAPAPAPSQEVVF